MSLAKQRYINYNYKKNGNPLEQIIRYYNPLITEIEKCVHNPNYTINIEKMMSPVRLYNYDYWKRLSCHNNITKSIVKNNPLLPWNPVFFGKPVKKSTLDSLEESAIDILNILDGNVKNIILKQEQESESIFRIVSKYNFLYNDNVYINNFQKDLKKRREKVKRLGLYRDLDYVAEKYLGYE